jgi:hypothetical protein
VKFSVDIPSLLKPRMNYSSKKNAGERELTVRELVTRLSFSTKPRKPF